MTQYYKFSSRFLAALLVMIGAAGVTTSMSNHTLMHSSNEEPNLQKMKQSITSIEELTSITRKQIEAIEKQTKSNSEVFDKFESPIDCQTNNDAVERSSVRLDGIEVYAVVSALTVASSLACSDRYGAIYSAKSIQNNVAVNSLHLIFRIANAVGLLTGLHSTFVFSLVTMYGRTAVGLGKDAELQIFFSKTCIQRYRGFQTFLWSLYCLTIQCAIYIFTLFVPESNAITELSLLMAIIVVIAPIFLDTNKILKEAEVIFSPSASTATTANRMLSQCSSLIAPPASSSRQR